MKDFILEQGNEVGGGTPEDFAELIKSESSKWSVVVKTAKIEPQ
jgi:tripartite-type tricarboxylate transporter receptor subunit TctC